MRRHGECKPPGEKLVVVDFLVLAGRLAEVRVSGDFFLFPDHALGLIDGALESADAAATPDQWASRIRAALPDGVEMLGVSPESIAEAVRRGLAT